MNLNSEMVLRTRKVKRQMQGLAVIGGLFGIPALIVLSSVWSGYVLTILWAWFIVPIFHLPTLTLAPAIGISLVTGYLTKDVDSRKDSRGIGEIFSSSLVFLTIKPLLALGMGWIVHQFM